ncbi:MAG: hypothetical protein JEZ03_04940 [Bacteroidales bacterium]|nr:hypothetical protein [Bacteroidales bacterium]
MKLMKYFMFSILLILSSYSGICQQESLSDTIDVTHYDIHLDILNVTEHHISGYTDVTLTTPLASIYQIPLELKELEVTNVTLDNNPLTFEIIGDRIIIDLQNPLNQGNEITLHIEYSGEPYSESWGGFHFAAEYAFNLGVGFDSDPHNLGKAWFPCVDDFNDRALYDLHIRVDDPNKAVCGGNLIETISYDDNTTEFHWKMDKTIPTYLASVAIGNYELVDDVYQGIDQDIPITYYVRPSEIDKVEGSFANMHQIMSLFESHFGAYPFARVGYSSTAKGAMEHVSNISYPYGAIDGGLGSEWWYTHELAHMWFGNQVTCSSAEDMWLNEGWARYCETFMTEGLYGVEAARNRINGLHQDVLKTAHISDDGYRALYGIPTDYTYGATVYDKGGVVVHTLRHYLGDELFFPAIRSYLTTFAYDDASSWDLRDHLTEQTGINMTDFFDAWVFAPGFPQFEVDSFNYVDGNCTVFIGQKLRAATEMYNSNRVDITFMDAQWNLHTQMMEFSGELGSQTFSIPFEPILVMPDFYDHIADATIDVDKTLKEPIEYVFNETNFKAIVNQITDSAFLRVSYNMVAPDTLENTPTGFKISPNRYWKIEGILPQGFSSQGKFFFSAGSTILDHELFSSNNDQIELLYRPNSSVEWQIVETTITGPGFVGSLVLEELLLGEYTVGVWGEDYIKVNELDQKSGSLRVFPNPSGSSFNFSTDVPNASIKIWNTGGEIIQNLMFLHDEANINWIPEGISKGMLFVQLIDENNKLLDVKKLIYQ